MKKWKVVITDREFETTDCEEKILATVNADVEVYQIKDEDALIDIVKDCDAIIMQYANFTRKVIAAASKCKIISKYAIGLDLIDIAAATEHNICVANVRDYCIDEVSTHAVALILDMSRKITLLNTYVKNGIWDYKISKKIYNLRGLTLGLNSFGKIAQMVAAKMTPFGVNIIAYDPYVSQEIGDRYSVKMVPLEELIEKSDILSSHLADMPETRGMLDIDFFKRMKSTAILINTGRGPVVNTSDLLLALERKEIAGAALDVTDPEPIGENHPLLQMENVIITPHAAYYSEDSQRALQSLTAENVVQRLSGYYPRFLANPEIKQKIKLRELESFQQGY